MTTKTAAFTDATATENTMMTTKTIAYKDCNDDGEYNDDDKDNIVHN